MLTFEFFAKCGKTVNLETYNASGTNVIKVGVTPDTSVLMENSHTRNKQSDSNKTPIEIPTKSTSSAKIASKRPDKTLYI